MGGQTKGLWSNGRERKRYKPLPMLAIMVLPLSKHIDFLTQL